MLQQTEKRNTGMDIIRCLALFFVVSVHYFSYMGFYSAPETGRRMFVLTLIRTFSVICVPLFLMLSGCLMGRRQISRGFFAKLADTLGVYAVMSAACLLYRVFALNETHTAESVIGGFLSFSHTPYGWYVEMYIGLFLLCPFLNVLYNNLKTKKEKTLLILVLFILTSLPCILNIYKWDAEWFLNPASAGDYFKIVPSYWMLLYPVTYYFTGCYLREYKLKLRCRSLLLLSAAVFVINGGFSFYRSHDSAFVWGLWQQYGAPGVALQAVLFFSFFDKLDYSRVPAFAARALKRISGLCFGGYLVSWIFDCVYYPILNNAVPEVNQRLNYYPLVTAAVYVSSLCLSFLLNSLYKAMLYPVRKITAKRKSKATLTRKNKTLQTAGQNNEKTL